jgi:hypothetical protein
LFSQNSLGAADAMVRTAANAKNQRVTLTIVPSTATIDGAAQLAGYFMVYFLC